MAAYRGAQSNSFLEKSIKQLLSQSEESPKVSRRSRIFGLSSVSLATQPPGAGGGGAEVGSSSVGDAQHLAEPGGGHLVMFDFLKH